jgi:signal transduction histidine kinase
MNTPSNRVPPVEETAAPPVLWHHLLQGRRLYINAWIRYLVAVAIVLGLFFSTHVVGVKGLDVVQLLICAGVLLIYNTAVMFCVRPLCEPEAARRHRRQLTGLSHLTITFDYLVLTYLIWLVGGAESPFLAFYLLHVVVAGVMMSRKAVYVHALLGYLLLAGLVVSEGLGWIPKNRPEGAVPFGGDIEIRYVLTVLVIYAMLMAGTAFLTSSVSQLLREGEQRLRVANRELEQLSELRRAFLHIALHDLKAPLAAISMLLTNLSSEIGGPLTEQQKHWVDRAQLRFKDMLGFLRDLQTLAELEAGQIARQAKPIDMSALLTKVTAEHQDLAAQKKQTLRVDTVDRLPNVSGVERMVHEALANYITNGLKYSSEGGEIVVRAFALEKRVRVEVKDNGRGIAPEDQKRLFKEFVRIMPKDGSGPQVAGTGLGLSIVRRIVDAHGGRVGVESAEGRGSTFFLELPLTDFVGSRIEPAV